MENINIDALYKNYYSLVFRRCYKLLRNKEEAENAANTVFEKLLSRKESIEFPRTYLYRMATNMGIDELMKRRREIHYIYAKATNISLSRIREMGEGEIWRLFRTNETQIKNDNKEIFIFDEKFEQVDAEIIIKKVLNETDEMTRDIFVMRYHDCMTLEQIGETFGIGKSTVENRLNDLKMSLRQTLGKDNK